MSLNFGILGCGRIAQRHAEHIFNLPEANLISVCDIDKKKANELGALVRSGMNIKL